MPHYFVHTTGRKCQHVSNFSDECCYNIHLKVISNLNPCGSSCYYRHSKKEKFFRRLYDIRDKEGNIVNDVVVVQYVWDGNEDKVKLMPHGNTKTTNTPYTATKDSVQKRLQLNLGRHNLKEEIDLTNDCP